MNELIERILRSLNLDADASDVGEGFELREDEGAYEGAIRCVSEYFDDIDEDEIRSVRIDEDPATTAQTLRELTTVREGEPFIATTTNVTRNSPNDRTIIAINTDDKDRHGTIIDPNGAELSNYRKNPVFLINHSNNLPAGNGADIRMQNGKLIAEISDENWNSSDDTELGRQIKFWHRLVKEGKVRMASVGIMPLEIDEEERVIDGVTRMVTVIKRWELLEFSITPVGSNPGALVLQRKLSERGFDVETLMERLDRIERLLESKFGEDIEDENGEAERQSSHSDERSEEENDSEVEDLRYVTPRKPDYKPPKEKRKTLDTGELLKAVKLKIKQKQGKA